MTGQNDWSLLKKEVRQAKKSSFFHNMTLNNVGLGLIFSFSISESPTLQI